MMYAYKATRRFSIHLIYVALNTSQHCGSVLEVLLLFQLACYVILVYLLTVAMF